MAALQPLKFLTVAARKKHTATVIFIHGLGDSGYGWKPVAEMLSRDSGLQHIKWVLPNAPTMPVTANMGMSMPSWFDLYSFDFDGQEDEPGMLQTVHSLNQLITAEVDAGTPSERILIGGFSQGGAMSLLTGFTSERKLGGVVVLSSWLPLRKKFKAMATDHARKLPVFWGHGDSDPLVPFQFGQKSVEFLQQEFRIKSVQDSEDPKTGLSFHSYPGMQHSSCEEEIDDLRKWMVKVLPDNES